MIHDPCVECLVRPCCRDWCDFKTRTEESRAREWLWTSQHRTNMRILRTILFGICALIVSVLYTIVTTQ